MVDRKIPLTSANELPERGSEGFRISESYMLGDSEETSFRLIPSMEVPLPDGNIQVGQLGPFIPHGYSLVLLVGESSAGKTVLGKNMAFHLAEGLTWADLPPPEKRRVLYVDLESPEDVYRSQAETIGRSENLVYARNLPQLSSVGGRKEFLSVCQEFSPGVVFVDSLSEAWPSDEENDNSEANRQMMAIKSLAKSLNCTIVVTWNMGEGNVKEKFKARGATARIDRSDLVLNYTELTGNTRQLKIVKSRYGTNKQTLTLRFSGEMGFEAITIGDEGYSPSAISNVQQQARRELQTGPKSRKELVKTLGNEDHLDKALHNMWLAGDVVRPNRGMYELKVSSEPPEYREKVSEETTVEHPDESTWPPVDESR